MPVGGVWLVDPAVRRVRVLGAQRGFILGRWHGPVRSARAACRTPARLAAPATAGRAPAASRTHRTIVPASRGHVTRRAGPSPRRDSLRPRLPAVSPDSGHETADRNGIGCLIAYGVQLTSLRVAVWAALNVRPCRVTAARPWAALQLAIGAEAEASHGFVRAGNDRPPAGPARRPVIRPARLSFAGAFRVV